MARRSGAGHRARCTNFCTPVLGRRGGVDTRPRPRARAADNGIVWRARQAVRVIDNIVPAPRLRRLVQLFAGLVLYGVSDGMLLLSGMGVDPWDVFHQGLSRHTGIAVGTWVIIVGAVVLLLWVPCVSDPALARSPTLS
jgi:hypothetical protein